jgi:hypothetical protein
VVAINRGTAPTTASFDAPAVWSDRPVRDVWSGEVVSRTTGGRIEAAIAPHGARIFTVEPFH